MMRSFKLVKDIADIYTLTEEQLRAGINKDLSPFRGGPPPGFGFGPPPGGIGPPDDSEDL